jgi:parallel beta-helix repeat protein
MALVVAGAGGVGLLGVEPAAASSSGLYVVVDASGAGDYTDLNQAVAETPANSTIFVRAGLYMVSGGLAPARGVRIVGEGYGSHVRLKDSANRNVFDVRNDNVTVEHLRVDGNGQNQIPGYVDCVRFGEMTGGRVLHCYVEGASGYNIVAYPGTSSMLFWGNRSVDALEEGIELYGASHSLIAANVVANAHVNGINIWDNGDSSNCVFANTVYGSGHHGIIVSQSAYNIAITANTCHSNGFSGITVGAPGQAVNISGNVASDNGGYGIEMYDASDCAIVANVVRGNALDGIYLHGVSGCSVRGNVASGNAHNGIQIEPGTRPARGSAVTGNVCSRNGRTGAGDGINMTGTLNGLVVGSNRCFDAQSTKTQRNGIRFTEPSNGTGSDAILLAGNLAEGNSASGIGTTNISPPRVNTIPYKRLSASVGPSTTAIAHGLSYTPRSLRITQKSPGQVWQAASPDATSIYLRADGSARSVEVMVG